MTIKQYVNLPKKDVFKDSDIDSIDRCGDISIEVEVDKADKAISYKAKVTPIGEGSDKPIYNEDELRRNTKFRLRKGVAGVIDSKKILVEGIGLPAAGGYKYKVEVQDAAGNTVSTPVEVETSRKLYYQKISMKTGTDTVPSYSMTTLETDSLQHYIKIESKGTERTIPYYKTVMTQKNNNNLNAFGASVAASFNIDNDLKKLGMAIVFTEYLAKKGARNFVGIIGLGSGGVSTNAKFTSTHLIITGDRYLWHGMNDSEDAIKEYFTDGAIQYVNPADSSKNLTYLLNDSDVEIEGSPSFTYGGYHQIKIPIQTGTTLETMSKQTSGIVNTDLNVKIVKNWTNGFSWTYSGANLITCARRVRWKDMPKETKDYTWVHEIGHRFGMTPWGDVTYGDAARRNKLPDAPDHMYYDADGKNYGGHQGPHCGIGATYDEGNDSWSGTPGCVMFGANGIGKNNHSPKEYCSECKPLVRKLDLSN